MLRIIDKKQIRIFLLGLVLLAGALILNYSSHLMGVMNWYVFLESKDNSSVFDYVWLFVVYPFCLGLLGKFGNDMIFNFYGDK